MTPYERANIDDFVRTENDLFGKVIIALSVMGCEVRFLTNEARTSFLDPLLHYSEEFVDSPPSVSLTRFLAFLQVQNWLCFTNYYSIEWSIDLLIDWLIDWLVGCSIDPLTDWLNYENKETPSFVHFSSISSDFFLNRNSITSKPAARKWLVYSSDSWTHWAIENPEPERSPSFWDVLQNFWLAWWRQTLWLRLIILCETIGSVIALPSVLVSTARWRPQNSASPMRMSRRLTVLSPDLRRPYCGVPYSWTVFRTRERAWWENASWSILLRPYQQQVRLDVLFETDYRFFGSIVRLIARSIDWLIDWFASISSFSFLFLCRYRNWSYTGSNPDRIPCRGSRGSSRSPYRSCTQCRGQETPADIPRFMPAPPRRTALA